jgi:ubiquinone/menaquinone biosynthesis C-methylase UbiE
LSRLGIMEIALRQPNIAEVFEKILVPGIFDRYARELVDRARPIGPSDRVLDLGCGTGIVARVLRERLGGAARITGLDAAPPMIAMAKSVAPELDFREGNAMALPFEDHSFDLVLSQQMLQFVPDRPLALREARRVLAPGGRLLLSTWRPRTHAPLHDALVKLAEKHLGPANDKRYSLDGDELRTLVIETGFKDVRIATATLTEQYRVFPPRLTAMGANIDTSGFSDEERERRFAAYEAEAMAIIASFTTDDIISAPSSTNIVTAIA